jgi:ABC-2 type transport system permease protein
MLPPVWQIVSRFNPILYIVDGYRYGFLGISDVSIWLSLSILIGTIIVFGWTTLYLFKKGYGLKS